MCHAWRYFAISAFHYYVERGRKKASYSELIVDGHIVSLMLEGAIYE